LVVQSVASRYTAYAIPAIKGISKRQKENLRAQLNVKFSDISSADENK
jgi:hypothetical protein